MHLLRPALAATAALTLTAAAAPAALAASSTTPSAGTAHSALTLLQVSIAGHDVTAGGIDAVATDAATRAAKLVLTPVSLDGTPEGQQTVTPANAPMNVPASPQSVSVANLLSVTGPTFAVDAKAGPTTVLTSAVLKALGSVDLKPAGLVDLPLDLQAASLANVAQVTATQAEAEKSISLGGLALPSVNDLLSGLGVNLTALLAQLTQDKLDALNGLVSTDALTALNTAVDSAQSALGSAPGTLSAATSALSAANTQLSAANGALTAADTAWSTAFGAIPAASLTGLGVPTSLTPSGFQALSPALQSSVDALSPSDLAALAATAVNAQSVQATAQTLVDNLNALVDALQALVNAVLAAVTGNSDPLASLADIAVTTKAVAAQTSPAPVATVSVGSLDVLGAAAPVSSLTTALGSVTSTLAGVLNSVAGVSFTPPTVTLGTPHTSRSQQGQTRKATASITGLTLTLPTITLPAALSTITANTPAASVVNGVVSVLGGTVKLFDVSEAADFTPAVTTTTPSTPSSPSPSTSGGSPSLASTGLSRTVPVAGALLVIAALAVLHRRRRVSGDS